MKVKIYGRKTGCKFCDTAKQVCEANKFDMEFIDIVTAGIDGDKLSELCSERVRKVKEFFVNDVYVPGGCTGFVEGLKEGRWN